MEKKRQEGDTELKSAHLHIGFAGSRAPRRNRTRLAMMQFSQPSAHHDAETADKNAFADELGSSSRDSNSTREMPRRPASSTGRWVKDYTQQRRETKHRS